MRAQLCLQRRAGLCAGRCRYPDEGRIAAVRCDSAAAGVRAGSSRPRHHRRGHLELFCRGAERMLLRDDGLRDCLIGVGVRYVGPCPGRSRSTRPPMHARRELPVGARRDSGSGPRRGPRARTRRAAKCATIPLTALTRHSLGPGSGVATSLSGHSASCARWPATSGERLKRREACEKTQRSLPLTARFIQLNPLGQAGRHVLCRAPTVPPLGARRQRIPDFTQAIRLTFRLGSRPGTAGLLTAADHSSYRLR